MQRKTTRGNAKVYKKSADNKRKAGSRKIKQRKSFNKLPFYKRWNTWKLWIGGLLCSIILLLLFYFFFIDPYSFRWRAMYGDPVYPKGFNVHGIDVSHYQEGIDWELVRNASLDTHAIQFAIIKATEGEGLIDEHFKQNFLKAKENDIIRGAYHFFIPGIDAKKQADFFIRQVQLEVGDLPPVLDIEKNGKLSVNELQEEVKTWLKIIETHYNAKPIIYTGYKFKMKYLNTPYFNEFPYWIAHYYVEELRYKGDWSFWQHTDRGKVNGINGDVDCNVFNGSYNDLIELTIDEDSTAYTRNQTRPERLD